MFFVGGILGYLFLIFFIGGVLAALITLLAPLLGPLLYFESFNLPIFEHFGIDMLFAVVLLVSFGSMAIAIIGMIVYFLAYLASKLIVRRIMFSFGVILFLSSRPLSIWHAWGEHLPQHAG